MLMQYILLVGEQSEKVSYPSRQDQSYKMEDLTDEQDIRDSAWKK